MYVNRYNLLSLKPDDLGLGIVSICFVLSKITKEVEKASTPFNYHSSHWFHSYK